MLVLLLDNGSGTPTAQFRVQPSPQHHNTCCANTTFRMAPETSVSISEPAAVVDHWPVANASRRWRLEELGQRDKRRQYQETVQQQLARTGLLVLRWG